MKGDGGANIQNVEIFTYDPNWPGQNLTLEYHEQLLGSGGVRPVLRYKERFDVVSCVNDCIAGGTSAENCATNC